MLEVDWSSRHTPKGRDGGLNALTTNAGYGGKQATPRESNIFRVIRRLPRSFWASSYNPQLKPGGTQFFYFREV